MSYNISKELFEAVMDIQLGTYYCDNKETQQMFWVEGTGNNTYICWDAVPFTDEISVNDFFFKCKEWAYNQNTQFYIESGYTRYDCYAKVWFDGGRNKEFKSDSEQQSVFNACQWILDNVYNEK